MKALFVTATAQNEATYCLISHLFKANNTDVTHIVILSTDFTHKKEFVKNLTECLSLPNFNLNKTVTIEERPLQKTKKSLLRYWIFQG